eukprot:scaffold2816_cov121-Cylindrotheca_fusiformis.AAC.60
MENHPPQPRTSTRAKIEPARPAGWLDCRNRLSRQAVVLDANVPSTSFCTAVVYAPIKDLSGSQLIDSTRFEQNY